MNAPIHTGTHLFENSQPRLGQFADSLADIHLGQLIQLDPFGRPYGLLRRWVGFKQFQYFGGISPQYLFGCAFADLRYAGAVFCYVYDIGAGQLTTRSFRVPLGSGLHMNDNPVQGESRFTKGNNEIRMRYDAAPRGKSLHVRLDNGIEIEAHMPETGFEPMSLCTRAGYSGWVYANKTAGLPLNGHLILDGKRHDLANIQACGHHDFSCGYMRRETFWNWACLSGKSEEGPLLGLNISCGVNETSFSENCAWLDGKLHLLGLARFTFDRQDVMKPWQITTQDGAVDLAFHPAGLHREHLQALVAASNFKQVFGHFTGSIKLDGKTYRIARLYGFVEDQYVKW